jgi:hypothetical protein
MAVSVRPAAPWGKGYEPWPPAGDVSLDDLDEAVRAAYGDLGEEVGVDLDRETRNELAMLVAATGADPEELVRRGIHALFRTTVDTGDLDFQLRRGHDVTYDEYLAGVTYEESTGGPSRQDDDRRYRQ